MAQKVAVNRPPPADPKGPHWIVMAMSPGPRQMGHTYYRHASEEAANAEAERLATVAPGVRFGVYAAGASFKVEKAAAEAAA
jgi:hypothetical protein